MDAGQKLGKYELLELVGKGAMGVVYRARDPDIDRTVAIKTVRKELIEDDERAGMILARFKNEARAAGRLSHPGIVAVYDYGESESVAYIAMEFVQGNSLREYFAGGRRFPEADVASIMVQLLEALAHAHEQGVWHRDVKPANLIVMKNGRVKVADFGIARIEASQLTQTGVLMGSQGYMAPEQYGAGKVDRRADLFAAGVVLYQLLTSTRPFTGTTEQIIYRICHEQPPAPSVADPGRGWERYDAVVARALAKKPEERFQSALEFREALLAAHGAEARATVSEDTIVALPTRPAGVFEPSNASWRTPGGGSVQPKGAAPAGSALARWSIAVAAAVAAAVGAGFYLREPEPVRQASVAPAPAPAAAPAAPAPAPPPAEKTSQPASPKAGQEKAETPPAPKAKRRAARPAPKRLAAAAPPKEQEEPAPAEDSAPAAGEASASVVFTVKPRGSVVFVDGERRGTIPPLTQLRLAPGDHHIEIRNGKGRPYVSDINLVPDDRLHIQYSFR